VKVLGATERIPSCTANNDCAVYQMSATCVPTTSIDDTDVMTCTGNDA
jgi:hypothetical protein